MGKSGLILGKNVKIKLIQAESGKKLFNPGKKSEKKVNPGRKWEKVV
jgi:hypothetical protein